MFQDHIQVEQRHARFVKVVCETLIVYALENEIGLATSQSNEWMDDEEKPVPVICFWSDRARAQSCVSSDWSSYRVTEISLSDFLENWCVGMYKDGYLVGTNFDHNMFGFEADPLELILEILEELVRIHKNISLRKYKSISDLELQVRNALNAR